MLTRILDTSRIAIDNGEVAYELSIDLRRMDRLSHSARPALANAYVCTVRPSVYLHNFLFELQYGIKTQSGFEPVGPPQHYNTETLPFLDD